MEKALPLTFLEVIYLRSITLTLGTAAKLFLRVGFSILAGGNSVFEGQRGYELSVKSVFVQLGGAWSFGSQVLGPYSILYRLSLQLQHMYDF